MDRAILNANPRNPFCSRAFRLPASGRLVDGSNIKISAVKGGFLRLEHLRRAGLAFRMSTFPEILPCFSFATGAL